jgi:hypothetical protein
LSSGPVGIGDRAGRTRREIVMRTCREDGVLVKPDVPIAALDRCFAANAYTDPVLLLGECHSHHPAGTWIYVVTLHASRHVETIHGRVATADLGALAPSEPVLAYDWRARSWARLEPGEGWDVALAFREWDYRILCPLLPGGRAVFGDVSKYATAGDRRIAAIEASAGRIRFEVRGAPGTWTEVEGVAPTAPAEAQAAGRALAVFSDSEPDGPCVAWQRAGGRWVLRLLLPDGGTSTVELGW